MADPAIHGRNRTLSASAILGAVASDLATIKREDGLTYAELGAVLGKSEDQAAKYAEGTAEMGIVAFARGKREWNGRFAGSLNRLVSEARGESDGDDRVAGTAVAHCAWVLARALEDGKIDPEEVRADRAALEAAREAIDAQLAKLTPRAA